MKSLVTDPRPFVAQSASPAATAPSRKVAVGWAKHLDEVREAQRLRYRVFAQEMGASLASPLALHDVDQFDDFCEHLLVRSVESGEVIGTYRLLTPTQAHRAGGLYSDLEFDLRSIDAYRPKMVELGRSCVHQDHRSGHVIMALWGALYGFMERNQLETMVGCASIPVVYNGLVCTGLVSQLWDKLQTKHLAAPSLRVEPRTPLPLVNESYSFEIDPPALITAYLSMGSKVLGPPAWDAQFNTADLPMLLQLADMPGRYRRHFHGMMS